MGKRKLKTLMPRRLGRRKELSYAGECFLIRQKHEAEMLGAGLLGRTVGRVLINAYWVTLKLLLLVSVPAGVVTTTDPVVAPAGTMAVI